jgi:hypothetical protein
MVQSPNGKKDIETRKNDLVTAMTKRMGPVSGNLTATFSELTPEQTRQEGLENKSSQSKEIYSVAEPINTGVKLNERADR